MNEQPSKRAIVYCVCVALLGCSSEPAPSGPQGSADSSASSMGTGGPNSVNGTDDAAESKTDSTAVSSPATTAVDKVGTWRTSAPAIPGSGTPVRLFVVDESWWILRSGLPGLSDQVWSHDGGKTWQRFSTAWRGESVADSTFWVLGIGADGAPLARWTHPDSCTDCLADAPGNPGDTYLVTYDSTSNSWQPLEVVPQVAAEVRDVARA